MTLARIILLTLIAAVLGVPAFAQGDEGAIKERIRARVAQVDQLKSAGVVGENNQGLLEQRGALNAEQSQLMNAENSDRHALYAILGSRLGLTPAVVGQQRAEQLRNNSAPGVWLQAPGGNWYKK